MRRPGTIPPRRHSESDQTIRDRRGIALGLIRCEDHHWFEVYRLPYGEHLGSFHDYLAALDAVFVGAIA
jgi:hypothetical protein